MVKCQLTFVAVCAPVPRITGTCVPKLTSYTNAVITLDTVAIVNYKDNRNTLIVPVPVVKMVDDIIYIIWCFSDS